jgi:hypothetical protein
LHELPKVAVLGLLKLILLDTESLHFGVTTYCLSKYLNYIVKVSVEIFSNQCSQVAERIELAENIFKIFWGVGRAL